MNNFITGLFFEKILIHYFYILLSAWWRWHFKYVHPRKSGLTPAVHIVVGTMVLFYIINYEHLRKFFQNQLNLICISFFVFNKCFVSFYLNIYFIICTQINNNNKKKTAHSNCELSLEKCKIDIF